MRLAAVAKRKKDTSDTNYKYILEKERADKEETVKKRKLACFGILEEIKILVIIILFCPLTLYKKKKNYSFTNPPMHSPSDVALFI